MNALHSLIRALFAAPQAFPSTNRRASGGSPGAPRTKFQPALEQLDERVLPALTPVTSATSAPLTAIVELKATFPDQHTVIGTGAMIDSFHVLTAAHLLYSASDGGYATSIEAIPALNNWSRPYGTAQGTVARVDPSWLRFNARNPGATSPSVVDVGLVTLNRAVGNATGWFNLSYNNNNAFFAGRNFKTAGYPSSEGFSPDQMYVSTGKLKGVTGIDGITFAQSNIMVLPGQSGSPLWITAANGKAVLYGVISGATNLSTSGQGYAARITQGVYTELKNWEKADHAPAFTSSSYGNQVTVRHPALPANLPAPTTNASRPAIQALDFWSSIGEVNDYSSSYKYYDTDGIWSGSYYYSPYGGYSFSTPDWYRNMSYNGYSRIGEVNAYTGNSYYNYYDSYGDYSGYSYEYNYYDW